MKKKLEIYNKYDTECINKILSFLNLDINSNSCGSFDRYFWGWKKKDFQDSTLMYSIYVLSKYFQKNKQKNNLEYYQKIALNNILKIIKKNGSIDQTYPNEFHPKNGLDITSFFYLYLQNNSDQKIKKLYQKIINYSLKKEENYGIICNHLAHHAYEYLLAYNYFKEKKYYNKAIENIKIINNHTSNEGWHKEYLGGDPGYQTRTLKYLTKSLKCLKKKDREICKKLCFNSADFLDKVVLPDGTLYSMFGSRNTALLYPSGIEYMAYHYPERYSNLVLRVRKSIRKKKAILPIHLDFDNFIRLFDDFLDAQKYYDKNKHIIKKKKNDEFDLKNFGLKKIKHKKFHLYIHYKYGGAIVVYRGEHLYYKDAGYLLKRKKEFYGTRNLAINSKLHYSKKTSLKIESSLFKSIHKELTPAKLIVLRILNLTLLRLPYVRDLFRDLLVKLMIVGKPKKNKNIFFRNIEIQKGYLIITDEFKLKNKFDKIYRALFLNLFHMASSRYFHPVNESHKIYKEIKNLESRSFKLENKINLD